MGIVLGIIPARGGSKRIPRKNLALCGGKPLLNHSIEAGLASTTINRLVVSTDDREIADAAVRAGADVPFIRPPDLSSDDTPMLPVLLHVLRTLDPGASQIEAVVLLQPTSPLRTAEHIDAAVRLLLATPAADSVVSVVEPAHIFHPLKMLKPSSSGALAPYVDDVAPVVGHRDLPRAYARNGPAVLVIRPGTLRSGALYGAISLPLVMPPESSVDIDTDLDLKFADFLLRNRA